MRYKFNPHSDSIVFFDTEFSSNDPYIAELLSIGMVKRNGQELYFELEYDGDIDPWVEENVIPYMSGNKVSREKSIQLIEKFVGETKPYIISFVNAFDVVYLTKLFGRIPKIFRWPPLDFASCLFAIGVDPEFYYVNNKDNFFKKIGIDASKFNTHNALDDAKLLREVYLRMIKSK